MSGDALSEAIAQAIVTMPETQLNFLADRIAKCATPAEAQDIARQPPVREFMVPAQAIVDAWALQVDQVDGRGVSAALSAAAASRVALDAAERVELVWTGPGSEEIRAAATSDVVVRVIDAAKHDLLLVSFASWRVDRIVDALLRARARGVDVSLLLETNESSEGQYSGSRVEVFPGVEATRYVWASDRRPRTGEKVAVMHAKFVLADSDMVFISSANLTGRALDDNIETGVLITGGPIPGSLRNHFRALAYDGTLAEV